MSLSIVDKVLKHHKIAHAYLFHGPLGSGRFEAAQYFAKALLCLKHDGTPCMHCLSCRKFDHHNHPDFIVVEPDGQSIKIEQVKHLQHELSFRNEANSSKVYVIKRAETLTVQAANSLLKMLEEPLPNIIAILLTNNRQAILPTIRSRVQMLTFAVQSPYERAELLVQDGVAKPLALLSAQMTANVVAAKELVEQQSFAEKRNVMIQLGKDSLTNFQLALNNFQAHIQKQEVFAEPKSLLTMLYFWYRDLIYVQTNQLTRIVFVDQLDWLNGIADRFTMNRLLYFMELTMEAEKKIRAHVSVQLAFEQLLIRIYEE